MKFSLIILLLLVLAIGLHAQTIEQIKVSNEYLWGYGTSTTLEKADNMALKDLISQISVEVKSSFQDIAKEENGQLKEVSESMVSTYSHTTLPFAERKVDEQQNSVNVIRYIPKADLKNIFEGRKSKITSYVSDALDAEQDLRIGDALRYYYAALILLRTHPDHNTISYHVPDKGERLLLTWIPNNIERNLSSLRFKIQQKEEDENSVLFTLHITVFDKPVQNIDYSYWTGDSWSQINNASDGIGSAELSTAVAKNLKELRFRIDYVNNNKARTDSELNEILNDFDVLPFRNEICVSLTSNSGKDNDECLADNEDRQVQANEKPQTANTKEQKEDSKIKEKPTPIFSQVAPDESEAYRLIMSRIMNSITSKRYSANQADFTPEGYTLYQKMITAGNARILDADIDKINYVQTGNMIQARSIPMVFSYPNNRSHFVENVVFGFSPDKKIANVSFAVSAQTANDIMQRSEEWGTPEVKTQLIQFLENYKSAFSVKDANYIESIFSENALIIVGRVLKDYKPIDGMYANLGEKIKYVRLSKQQYIENLKHAFASNEFINIQFESTNIKKVQGENIYGIQIAQNYTSSTYADKGYLFLMLDLNDPNEPKIYVRSWQPEKNPDGSIIGLTDFHF